MIWTGGAVRAPGVVETYGSQIDLAATLLGQLGIAHGDYAFSKDLFAPEPPRKFAYYTFNDGFGVVDASGEAIWDATSDRAVSETAPGCSTSAARCSSAPTAIWPNGKNPLFWVLTLRLRGAIFAATTKNTYKYVRKRRIYGRRPHVRPGERPLCGAAAGDEPFRHRAGLRRQDDRRGVREHRVDTATFLAVVNKLLGLGFGTQTAVQELSVRALTDYPATTRTDTSWSSASRPSGASSSRRSTMRTTTSRSPSCASSTSMSPRCSATWTTRSRPSSPMSRGCSKGARATATRSTTSAAATTRSTSSCAN